MVEIFVEYEGELRTEAVHGPSGTKLRTDAPKDNHGRGESFSPTDLLATSLGSCMLSIMGIRARSQDLRIEGTRLSVTKEMVADPERRVGRLNVIVDMVAGLSEEQRELLEDAALTCPVAMSLNPEILVGAEFRYPD